MNLAAHLVLRTFRGEFSLDEFERTLQSIFSTQELYNNLLASERIKLNPGSYT